MSQNDLPPNNHRGCSQTVFRKAALGIVILTIFCLFAVSPGQVFAEAPGKIPGPGQIAPTKTTPGPQTPDRPAEIPELLQKLLDHDPQTRAAASQSLRTIPPEIKIPALTDALLDPNWKIQVLAAHHLGQMGAAARGAIPALTEALSNPNPDVRFTLAKALGKIGSATAAPALTQAIQDKDENVRMAAAEALNQLGPDAQAALPALQKTLRDGNWFVRTRAAAAFVRLAAQSKEMLPVLLNALGNPLWESLYGSEPKYQLRRQDEIPAVVAVDALAGIGPKVIPSVLEYFQEKEFADYFDSDEYFPNLIVTLVTVGSKAGNAQVVELLIDAAIHPAISDSNQEKVIRCLENLAYISIFGKNLVRRDSAEKLTSALVAALQNWDWHIRVAAVVAISRTDSGSAAMPYLTSGLQDPDWRVRTSAAVSLGVMPIDRLPEIPSEKYNAFLIAALRDADWRVRLGCVGANSFYERTSMLLPLLQDQNEVVRLAAAFKLTGESEPAQAILIHALQHHRDARIRLAALRALQPETSPAAASALIQTLQDDSAKLRASAASALEKVGDAAVPPLIETLQDKDTQVRMAAVRSLGHIGSPEALPALIAALNDPEAYVRDAAKYALGESTAMVMSAAVT